MKIATFSSVWGSSTGGIDVFNKELIKALTSNKKQVEVFACYLANTDKLQNDSKALGFNAVTPGKKRVKLQEADIGRWDDVKFMAVMATLKHEYNSDPDVFLLHDTFCAELPALIRKYFKKAKIVTFFHSSYGRSDKAKPKSDGEVDKKESAQRKMLEESDFAISVGSYALNYLESLNTKSNTPITHILPGLPKFISRATPSSYFSAMSFGRLDPVSDRIKKISVSAKAWLNALESGNIENLKTTDVRFYAIGSSGKESVLEQELNKLSTSTTKSIRVIEFEEVDNFDTSNVKEKMESCSFVLLNSWYENFGLTYLETCTFGTPTIISENSGFYHDLIEVIGQDAVNELVTSVSTEGVEDDALIDSLKGKLIAKSAAYNETFKKATELRNLLEQKWPSWEQVANELCDKLATLIALKQSADALVQSGIATASVDTIIPVGNNETIRAVDSDEPIAATVPTEPAPWPETLEELSKWCWRNNESYYSQLLEKDAFTRSFKYPLTQMQKSFWDKREELLSHPFRDLVLSGGTSSGKTTLAEHLFGISRPAEFDKARILYIAPTKALAQERAKAWAEQFPSPKHKTADYEPVIVSTGDNNASDGALMRGEFIIASTVYEKANVMLSASQELFKKLSMIVIDEFHMVEDLHRGSILECLLAKVKLEKKRRHLHSLEQQSLRLVVITTEKAGNSLTDFLTFYDPSEMEDISPLVLEDTTRAIPVTHKCILPGKVEIEGGETKAPATFEIKTFEKEQPLILSSEEARALNTSFDTFRSSLTQIPENHGFDAKRIRLEYYRELIEEWMDNNLYGHRLLIFMSSKVDVLSVAENFKNLLKDRFAFNSANQTEILANEQGISDTLRVISEVEETSFTKSLRVCAEEGVFIHNADVPQRVRESFESYLGTPVPADCRSEIILATQTLSFGVNLKVTDVTLLNVMFPESERVQTGQPTPMLLSRCDFANMAGRAGRLGQTKLDRNPNVSWFLDPEAERSFPIVLESFYVSSREIQSRLFYRSDASIQAKINDQEEQLIILDEEDKDGSPSDKAIEQFSYPFSRSVLDAVRFLGGTDSEIGYENHTSCSDKDVFNEFFKNTLYYSENCKFDIESDDEREVKRGKKKNKELYSAIKRAIDSALQSDYKLIERNASGKYKITNLGCSTIDTGTEITTVKKLRSFLLALKDFWGKHFSIHLPFELAILPVFFQQEVYRQYLGRMPEFRLAMDWDPTENRNDLIKRAASQLTKMQVIKENDQAYVQSILQESMDWTLKNQPIVKMQGGYEEAPLDGCLRLYVAFLSWISGARLRDVIAEIQKLYPSSGQTTNSSVINFESFAENLTWKLMFLVSLIRASEDNILSHTSTYNAVHFVMRSRFGCIEAAIPLLFKNKSSHPPINRVKVHALLAQGYSSADVASGKHRDYDELTNLEKRRLQTHVKNFVRESFQELFRQFNYVSQETTTELRKANEKVAKEYWSYADRHVKNTTTTKVSEVRWVATREEDVHALSQSIQSDDKAGPLLLLKGPDFIQLQLFSADFDGEGSERIQVKKQKQYTVYFSADSFHAQHNGVDSTQEAALIVDFLPTTGSSQFPPGIRRLSPAAFGILISLCARSFITDVARYLEAVVNYPSQRTIGTKKLYEISDRYLKQSSGFPEALFEAWAKFTEIDEYSYIVD
ncbi:DEAD/DEAH box helicase [Vibrio harveyi]|nr:DEAD/DEAH box helicase [Vibrio harveyi]